MAEQALNESSPAQYSRFVQRLHRRYENWFDALPPGPPDRALMEQALNTLQQRGLDLSAALRVLRQLVMERCIVLDCEQSAPLSIVVKAVTELAELARLDARQAARRPDFALSGTLGWRALTLAALGGSGALVATLAASVDWPVHDGGLLAAQVEAQQAVLEQARLSWRAATLTAAQDAEDSLAAAAGSRAQARALGEAVTAATQALALARQRYQAGLIDFTTLLDAQRTLLTLQTSQIGAEVDLRQNLIRLFKALGGGLSAADLAALPVRAAATR